MTRLVAGCLALLVARLYPRSPASAMRSPPGVRSTSPSNCRDYQSAPCSPPMVSGNVRNQYAANKKGSHKAPLQGVLLCSSSAYGLVVFVGSPVGHRPNSSPIRDIKNKRIILVADVATALTGSTGSGAASRQFYFSRSGRQETCRAIPLQKNQFATSPTCLFLLCRSRYVLFLLLGVLSCSCCAD
ncbi:hypothetical protein Psest_2441 [Stutzerimonas stutzeri RCH2]|uniref:Secreted protein n=1 Tax=Stutzerimonas stutzeri RCH2 TaxID=644801 RepID=L0GJP5_STUST|nr:hypothetical protein Psest_2441 [Stutzerimonas stutzeri RCH2]